MKEIKYYLKKHIISTVVAMLLFVIQGLCVVALIICGNDIIDVGLLQYGYESSAPEALIATSFEKRIEVLSAEDRNFVVENYTLLDKDNMTAEEYQFYENRYPAITSQLIYKKNWIGLDFTNQKLEEVFSISQDEMIYEYVNLGMKPMDNQKAYINDKIKVMIIAAVIFAITFAGANTLVASVASRIGYEERQKVVEFQGIGLTQGLDLQDKAKSLAGDFYALVLATCGIAGAFYYWKGYQVKGVVDESSIAIWIISLVVFSLSIYSAISVRGRLNKGLFLVVKVAILGAITAIFGSKIAIGIILVYGIMLGILSCIRRFINNKLNILLVAHEENIDNIDGQMSFVINKDNVEIEPVAMKRMVRSYLSNNEYLYRSSWMLEILEGSDKVIVALFNFMGVIVTISIFSYLYINLGLPIILILPLLIVFCF